ncbi:hypothetical protein [Hungatella hathewayi]|uniref:hypothetical protein n=1 Tax=Hungatella hathewayi TaxID=154046 RepID=UPI0035678384
MKMATFFGIITIIQILEVAMAMYLSIGGFKFTEKESFITVTKLCIVGSFFTTGATLAIGLGSLLVGAFGCFL